LEEEISHKKAQKLKKPAQKRWLICAAVKQSAFPLTNPLWPRITPNSRRKQSLRGLCASQFIMIRIMVRLFTTVMFLCLLLLGLGYSFVSTADAGLSYGVTVIDPENALGADRTAVLADFDAAVADWRRYIQSSAYLEILIDVTTHTGGAGRFSGRSFANVFHHMEQGLSVSEEGATYKLRTGKSAKPGEPDLVIQVQPELMHQSYWIDPRPEQRTDPVPPERGLADKGGGVGRGDPG
jgi:hypothetical protein